MLFRSAGVRAGAPVTVSADADPGPAVRAWLEGVGVTARIEDDAQWRQRAAALAASGGRVRLLGGSAAEFARATDGSPAVALYAGDVVSAGRVEMLPFVREQAVSLTAHCFGTPRRYDVPAARG